MQINAYSHTINSLQSQRSPTSSWCRSLCHNSLPLLQLAARIRESRDCHSGDALASRSRNLRFSSPDSQKILTGWLLSGTRFVPTNTGFLAWSHWHTKKLINASRKSENKPIGLQNRHEPHHEMVAGASFVILVKRPAWPVRRLRIILAATAPTRILRGRCGLSAGIIHRRKPSTAGNVQLHNLGFSLPFAILA